MEKSVSSQVERILSLYRTLPRAPQRACTIEKLKPQIRSFYDGDIDEKSIGRKIRRDLQRLKKILVTGSVLCTTGKGNQPDKFRLSSNASLENQSSELALVLVMANDYIRQNIPYQFYEKVEGFFVSAQEQLKGNTQVGNWHSRVRFVPEGYSSASYQDKHNNAAQIQLIYNALLDDDACLFVSYRKEGRDEETEYTLKPHGIIQHGNKQYLMASKIENRRSKLRTFNMQRFDKVEIIAPQAIVSVDSYDLDELVEEKEYENAFFEREELEIKLRCDDYLRNELEENPINSSQNTESADEEGYFYLTASCMVTTSVLNWLIEKSHSIKVVEPTELYEKVRLYAYNSMLNYDTECLDIKGDKLEYSYGDDGDAAIEDADAEIEDEI